MKGVQLDLYGLVRKLTSPLRQRKERKVELALQEVAQNWEEIDRLHQRIRELEKELAEARVRADRAEIRARHFGSGQIL
jgi:hypothetical protein